MEDNLISLSCPNCKNSLLDAALMNPMFLHKADCPFCGQKTRWARLPVTLMTSGALMIGLCILSMTTKIKIPLAEMSAIGIGLGSGCFIFGFLFLRFIAIEQKEDMPKSSGSHFGHIHN